MKKQYILKYFWRSAPETLTNRQSTQHGCLPSLLGDRDEGIEIVYGEEKQILYGVDQGSEGRTKISCIGSTTPTNQPKKDSFYLHSLSLHAPSVSTVGRGNPSLVSLDRSFKISIISGSNCD
jgi:hypothetical protein